MTTPSQQQYDELEIGPPVTGHGGSPPPTGLDAPVEPLPFTGFDLILMTAVALAVTGTGLFLRKVMNARDAVRGMR